MTQYRRSRWRLLMMAQILATASTASALSLENFQLITSDQIPSSCIRAYDTNIQGCSVSDFTNGNQCSAQCVRGLQAAAIQIINACGDLNIDSSSLLGLTLLGGLVDALCPGFQATTVTLTVQPSTTNGGGFTTPTPVLTTRSTSSTTSTRSTESTTKQTISTTTSVSQQTSSTDSITTTTPVVTETSSTSTSTTSAAQTSSGSDSDDSGDDDGDGSGNGGSGGGSPFDTQPLRGVGSPLEPNFGSGALLAAGFIIVLL
ncbi:hypothetical protein F5Y15DRAFT_141572 [Xylariaceae sp. FL0016]|nr:hypothetical protein F5Y15DRAFT_141572 [Xylariaceae sp. FL0016]